MTITPPVIQHSDWQDADERVVLFTIVNDATGQRVEYSMPKRRNAGLALSYMKQARTIGEELASSWLLEQVLGSEGYDALAAEPDVTFELIAQISRAAVAVAFGRSLPSDEAPTGEADPFE